MELESLSYLNQLTGNEWTLKGPFSLDLLLGLLAAGCMLFKIARPKYMPAGTYPFSASTKIYGKHYVIQFRKLNDYRYYPKTPTEMQIQFGRVVELSRLTEKEIKDHLTKGVKFLRDRNYAICISSETPGTWDLINIGDPQEFMQGFISMCNAFRVDFRDYILGPPFGTNGIEYDVVGAHITSYLSRVGVKMFPIKTVTEIIDIGLEEVD